MGGVGLRHVAKSEWCDFGETLDSLVSGVNGQNEMCDQVIDQVRVEDEVEWDPAQECLQCAETGFD